METSPNKSYWELAQVVSGALLAMAVGFFGLGASVFGILMGIVYGLAGPFLTLNEAKSVNTALMVVAGIAGGLGAIYVGWYMVTTGENVWADPAKKYRRPSG